MVKARGKREGARKREEFCAVVIVFLKKNPAPVHTNRVIFSEQQVKVKFSHTRYRALGPELIPVYRQSARR